tara:strand:- start:1387 stop:1626 length:240 start_codon:yes stop_codon:yes gene_type:complete
MKKTELDRLPCEWAAGGISAVLFKHPELDANGTTKTMEYVRNGTITHRGQTYVVRACEIWRKINGICAAPVKWRLYKVN